MKMNPVSEDVDITLSGYVPDNVVDEASCILPKPFVVAEKFLAFVERFLKVADGLGNWLQRDSTLILWVAPLSRWSLAVCVFDDSFELLQVFAKQSNFLTKLEIQSICSNQTSGHASG